MDIHKCGERVIPMRMRPSGIFSIRAVEIRSLKPSQLSIRSARCIRKLEALSLRDGAAEARHHAQANMK